MRDLPIADLMGETMRNAGMAITITSLTNFIVFAIGATTVNQLKGQCHEMDTFFSGLQKLNQYRTFCICANLF